MIGAEELAALAAEAPLPLRVLIGAIGTLLLVAGARIYRVALFGSVFSLGAVGAALGLAWGGQFVVALGRPEVIALGAIVAGAALAGVAKVAHKVGLLAIGGVGGLALGAGIGDLIGGVGSLWGPLIGVVSGAVLFPFFFESLLKFVTPFVGAVCLSFALGHPERLWVLGLLWAVGVLIQLGWIKKRPEPPSGG